MMILIIPFIAPSSRKHPASEFRAVLQVVQQSDLGSSIDTATETGSQEGGDEAWKGQTSLSAIFLEIGVIIAFQALDGLEGTTKHNTQVLGAVKDVSVLIGQRSCCTQVTCRIGALRLERQR